MSFSLIEPELVGFGVARYSVFALEYRHVELVLRQSEPLRRRYEFQAKRTASFLK
jgi:hypothetical protein